MIQHVYQRALDSGAEEVIIATEHELVAQMARSFGATVCMTGAHHLTGTDRIAEVVAGGVATIANPASISRAPDRTTTP